MPKEFKDEIRTLTEACKAAVISFPSIDRWLLRPPSQRLQPTRQVVRMVAHPKRHQNHRTDAPEHPPIRVKASFQSPLFEDRQHTLPLFNTQAGWTAGNGAHVQAGHVALMLVELLSACAGSHPTNPESVCNICMGELSGLEQPPGFQAPFFALAMREMS